MTETKKTKKCSKCGRELSIDDFYKDNRAKDGLQCWCKGCYNGYRQTNKEHYNRYQRQYWQTNSQYLKECQRQYRQTNKEHINQRNKEYYDRFKGYYLYIILGKNNEIVYVGQTTNYYKRLYNHLSGYVDSTKELFANNEWSCIKYLNVGDIVENEAELRALENELIELYKPRLNTRLNIINDIDRGRLFGLLAQLHSILNEWIVFKTNNN